jgi:hypothetical protein
MTVSESRPQGRIKVERPILRWTEDTENGLRKTKMKRWRQQENEGKELGSAIREDKVAGRPYGDEARKLSWARKDM